MCLCHRDFIWGDNIMLKLQGWHSILKIEKTDKVMCLFSRPRGVRGETGGAIVASILERGGNFVIMIHMELAQGGFGKNEEMKCQKGKAKLI